MDWTATRPVGLEGKETSPQRLGSNEQVPSRWVLHNAISVLTSVESVVFVGMLRPDVSSWQSCHEAKHLDGALSGSQSRGNPIDDASCSI